MRNEKPAVGSGDEGVASAAARFINQPDDPERIGKEFRELQIKYRLGKADKEMVSVERGLLRDRLACWQSMGNPDSWAGAPEGIETIRELLTGDADKDRALIENLRPGAQEAILRRMAGELG